jgi:hypothetical protein
MPQLLISCQKAQNYFDSFDECPTLTLFIMIDEGNLL